MGSGDVEFLESRTYRNLLDAFNREARANTKYQLYAQKARQEGYIQISNIFIETAWNEQQHAKIWHERICAGKEEETLANLRDAARSEERECSDLYKSYAQAADQEGYGDIAQLFREVAEIEQSHNFRYSRLAQNMESGRVFCKTGEVLWVCLNCGYIYSGICAPKICPVCRYPQGFYELNCENY